MRLALTHPSDRSSLSLGRTPSRPAVAVAIQDARIFVKRKSATLSVLFRNTPGKFATKQGVTRPGKRKNRGAVLGLTNLFSRVSAPGRFKIRVVLNLCLPCVLQCRTEGVNGKKQY